MKQGYVTSDLHYFSRRSLFEHFRQPLLNKIRVADIFVLNGDIFDFRWCKNTQQEAVEMASALLKELMLANPDCEFKYLLGNHDCIPQFSLALEELAKENPKFSWQTYHLQLGELVFLHGDILHCNSIPALDKYRSKFHDETEIYSQLDQLYDIAHRLRIPYGVGKLFSKKKTVEKLHSFLESSDSIDTSCVSDVFFGHTHHPFQNYLHSGILYHNTGAVLRGMKWQIHEFIVENIK